MKQMRTSATALAAAFALVALALAPAAGARVGRPAGKRLAPLCPEAPPALGAPKLLLHIGTWKTGSTSFQEHVSRCTAAGLYAGWPKLGNKVVDAKAYASVAFALRKRPGGAKNRPNKIMNFVKNIPGQKIVSSEEFSGLEPAEIRQLACLTSGYNVTIVFVYRNGAALMRSIYNQNIKVGQVSVPFEEFVKSYPMTFWRSAQFTSASGDGRTVWGAVPMAALNEENVIANYVSVFGEDKVKVLDLDGLDAHHADLTDAILEAGGMRPLPGRCKLEEKHNAAVNTDRHLVSSAFSRYVQQKHRCTMRSGPTNSLNSFTPPRKCTNFSRLLTIARARDSDCRKRFGHLFRLADINSTDRAIQKELQHCEVDVEHMMASATWQERFAEQFTKTRQLCK
jgi:hypothetical protein